MIEITNDTRSLAELLEWTSPFYFTDEEKRESGHTANRTLAETSRAFHEWCKRYPTR